MKDKKAVIYRETEIALTKKALEFVDFIRSKEAQKVYLKRSKIIFSEIKNN
ncbi:hypothetical protein oki169_24670 [Helicobacter pylori]